MNVLNNCEHTSAVLIFFFFFFFKNLNELSVLLTSSANLETIMKPSDPLQNDKGPRVPDSRKYNIHLQSIGMLKKWKEQNTFYQM